MVTCQVVYINYCIALSCFCFRRGRTWRRNTCKSGYQSLKEGATRETKKDFIREVDIMTSFDHPNILPLLAIVDVGMYVPVYDISFKICYIFIVL